MLKKCHLTQAVRHLIVKQPCNAWLAFLYYIKEHHLTQAMAAKMLGVSQPRISDLKRGLIQKFTIDMLVNMLAKAHVSVSLVINDRVAA